LIIDFYLFFLKLYSMTDMLQKRLDYIKSISGSAKRRASLYSDMGKIHDKKTSKALGAIQRASAPGKKLQKVGFIMLWIPEPTGVTFAVGGPMILAGRYLDKKYNGATIHDIGHSTREIHSSISNFKDAVF
jgi:hypothetical protein